MFLIRVVQWQIKLSKLELEVSDLRIDIDTLKCELRDWMPADYFSMQLRIEELEERLDKKTKAYQRLEEQNNILFEKKNPDNY